MQLTLSSHKSVCGFSAYIGKLLRKNDRADCLIAHDGMRTGAQPSRTPSFVRRHGRGGWWPIGGEGE